MAESHVYVGLAGDTDPGRFLSAGLLRSRNGSAPWEPLGAAFPAPPQVRAILTDPFHPGRVTVGTQDGLYRSDNAGLNWRRLAAPPPGLAVWSLARHPTQPGTIFAGYEPCAIYRSHDDGETWGELPVATDFPDITMSAEPSPKRVTGIAVDPSSPSEIYASIEVGGLLKSTDAGEHWCCVTNGLYVADDAVDLHGVVCATRIGCVTVIGRIGTFRSNDGGKRWKHLGVPSLRPRGTYCRALGYAPDSPRTLYVGAGNDFDGDQGALFVSHDDGDSWACADLGVPLKSTIFALAFDPRQPAHVYCSSKYGGVFSSHDRGATWALNSLPAGAGHVFALAVG
jgi:photosystem II stability/assembly factor-like uncharacterized protein